MMSTTPPHACSQTTVPARYKQCMQRVQALVLKVQGGRTAFDRKKHKDTFLLLFFSLVRKERKGQKEESVDSRLGDADTHASHMCQSLF